MIDERAENEMQTVIDLITKVRNIRAEMNIKPSDKPAIHVAASGRFAKNFPRKRSANLKTRPRD